MNTLAQNAHEGPSAKASTRKRGKRARPACVPEARPGPGHSVEELAAKMHEAVDIVAAAAAQDELHSIVFYNPGTIAGELGATFGLRFTKKPNEPVDATVRGGTPRPEQWEPLLDELLALKERFGEAKHTHPAVAAIYKGLLQLARCAECFDAEADDDRRGLRLDAYWSADDTAVILLQRTKP